MQSTEAQNIKIFTNSILNAQMIILNTKTSLQISEHRAEVNLYGRNVVFLHFLIMSSITLGKVSYVITII